MKNQTLEIKTRIQILKPPHEVFEAIVDPAKMTNYFITYFVFFFPDTQNQNFHNSTLLYTNILRNLSLFY